MEKNGVHALLQRFVRWFQQLFIRQRSPSARTEQLLEEYRIVSQEEQQQLELLRSLTKRKQLLATRIEMVERESGQKLRPLNDLLNDGEDDSLL